MEQVSLNLARKWRSKNFQEIIGQDLVVRILQNSLFKQAFFPVYLFSGQRGCGKTSTARVFAAAMNCQNLEEFQKNPKQNPVPCATCESCVAMMHMRHPDFVEIDAASYTGVDNIRNIIDTSSFLPVMSKRKVYLIDEVHMLSKAAFNALLKILEEPPAFVVFILATTEVQKLPDTVKSRCFQLFFTPVQLATVTDHLQAMCDKESIASEKDALELIARVSQGSLRDAINLLEQSRFVGQKVTKEVVSSVLGYIDDSVLYNLAVALFKKDKDLLMEVLATFDGKVIAVDYISQRLQELVYDAIMLKYSSKPKYFFDIPATFEAVVQETEVAAIMHCFDILTTLDQLLAKTSKKELLLESQLLSIVLSSQVASSDQKKKLNNSSVRAEKQDDQQVWSNFVQAVSQVVDPVLYSMLCESSFVQSDQQKKVITISTLKKFVMFQDLFIDQKGLYQPYLERFFGAGVMLFVEFVKVDSNVHKVKQSQRNTTSQVAYSTSMKSAPVAQVRTKVDISDEKKWELTHTLLKHFGGTVSEIIKDNHESNG